MTDLHDFRLVTASAYPGMMAPLTEHPSCVCVLSGDAAALPGDPGSATPVLSLEGLDGVRRRWRFGDVARLADFVPKVLAEAPADDRPILLVPPRASTAWEAAAAAWPGRVRLGASPQSVVERLAGDKVYIRTVLAALGVPVPEAVVGDATELSFAPLARRLGTPFVAQTPNGAGGQGTYLVHEAAEFAAALVAHPHTERWLVSRFAGHTTINCAGIVHHDGVRLLPASTQISGIDQLGLAFGGYCGSDFTTPSLNPDVLARAYDHTAAIGHWLREQGHRGLFGVDIAVSGDELAFLEVNPRIQGSSWLLGRLQQRQGGTPCLEQHLLALLGDPLDGPERHPDPVGSGSHLLIRWQGPAGVVRALPTVTGFDPLIEVSGLPGTGVSLLPGAILGRIESTGSLAVPDGRTLTSGAASLVDTLINGVEISPLG
ncbi:ATP-grasp domain-containing protein [Catellatospora tritici]|uniref:ATP-grasp domain-containing protein n=1 Tax=Catellatospora tritici TaxID=2851566 RepID=UPI001C2CEE52|nr:ATP-grasp domain-containing protein [Catellatospora tritici]MBV1855258.1 ATP-grasp domain-containing protein [Catellatospora tritici]